MRFKRLWAIFNARNREFFRDRAAFGWNFLFPFLIILGFGVIFKGDYQSQFKVGHFPIAPGASVHQSIELLPDSFTAFKAISLVAFETRVQGMDKLKHHKIDLLIETGTQPIRYWVSDSSPSGAIVERLLKGALLASDSGAQFEKKDIQGIQIRYIDWLFPGVLGMNMMFSALYGVGWVVVRYRKNGVLKRLKATPLTAFEYLAAQLLSRIFLLMFTLVIVWVGCDWILGFRVYGSLPNLFLGVSGGQYLHDITGPGHRFARDQRRVHQWRAQFYILADDVLVRSMVLHRGGTGVAPGVGEDLSADPPVEGRKTGDERGGRAVCGDAGDHHPVRHDPGVSIGRGSHVFLE